MLWLGGGCGAGKSSIARELAHRFDLQLYPVDAHGWDHHRRLGGRHLGSHDERWLLPTPEELAEHFVAGSKERLPLILDDMHRMRGGPLVIAEGPQLIPDLVARHVASHAHGVWLVPTQDFMEWALRKRGGMDSPTSDHERALQNRLGRDAILNSLIRLQAAELGFTAIDVDGSQTLPEVEEVIAGYFAELIIAGPRALDGDERRRIRRAENVAIYGNLTANATHLSVSEPPSYRFVCECTTLGCRDSVLLPINEYGRILEHPARFLHVHAARTE